MAEINVERRDPNRTPIWPWILGALLLIGLVWAVVALLDRTDDDNRMTTTTRTETTSDRGLAYDSEEDRVRNTAVTGYEAQGPIREYALFADREGTLSDADRTNVSDRNVNQQADAGSEMAYGNEYVSEGLRRLSAAIDAVASQAGMPASGQANTNSDTRATTTPGTTETGTGAGTTQADRSTTATGTTAEGGNIDQMHQSFKQRAERMQQNPQNMQSRELRSTFVEAASLIAALRERHYPNTNVDVADVRQAAEGVQANRQISEQENEVREFFRESSEALQAMDQQRFQDNQQRQQQPTNNNNR
jgi:hypothetical protein